MNIKYVAFILFCYDARCEAWFLIILYKKSYSNHNNVSFFVYMVFKVKDMKRQFDDMLKEKEVTEKRCEHEIQELMSTMEKFHQTNGKLVEDKDKEIENLKKEISRHKDLSKSEVQCHYIYD